ncbi:ATP-binding protein [Desulfonauticus submarinus]
MLEEILSLKLYPRAVFSSIVKWLPAKELILILGARQVGKTCLLYSLIQYLIKQGVSKNQIFYFDLENFEYLELVNSGVNNFLRYLRTYTTDKKYIFLDEIQYMDNPSNFLKLLVDHYHHEIKLFVTGSSGLTMRHKFKDALVGRRITFELFPLSFKEFLVFKEKDDVLRILKEATKQKKPLLPIHHQQIMNFYEEYVLYGGYPAVALLNDLDMKKRYLNDIYNAYVHKDISAIFNIENIMAYNRLVKLLALQMGNLVNVQELSKNLGVARKTVEKFLKILEDTYVCLFIRPFFSNKQKELVKMPKIFWYDTGLRNRIVSDFKPLDDRVDKGNLLENTVFKELLFMVENKSNIKFWRTKHGNEVDFILDEEQLSAWEVKSGEIAHIPSGLRSFLQYYPQAKAFVVNERNYKIEKNTCFLPFYLIGF